MFQAFQKLGNLWRLLPVILNINLELTLCWACYQVICFQWSSTDWAYPWYWCLPARDETFPAHPMYTWCEHGVICRLHAYGTLGIFTPPDALNNLFNVCWSRCWLPYGGRTSMADGLNNLFNACFGGSWLPWSGKIRICFHKPSCILVQFLISLDISSTARSPFINKETKTENSLSF